MTAASIASPRELQQPKPPDGLGVGAALAVLVHLLLVAALAFGVNWRTREPETVAAELWSAVPQMAAPRATAPPPAAPPPPPPVPEKRVAPTPPQPAPPPTARLPDAQISIERKREEARRQAEEREAEPIAAKREKAQQVKAAAAEQAQREAAKREQLQRETEARQKRELAEKEKEKREEATLQAQREANLRRIQGQAGATSDEGAGTASRASGPSSGYEARIMARILPKIIYPDSASESKDLVANVEVRCSPDGTILSRKLLRSSGKPAWDDAVLRAIDKTEMLPRDVDGRVPPVLLINFRPHS